MFSESSIQGPRYLKSVAILIEPSILVLISRYSPTFLGSTVTPAGLPCAFNVWLDHRIVKEDVGQECRPAILPLWFQTSLFLHLTTGHVPECSHAYIFTTAFTSSSGIPYNLRIRSIFSRWRLSKAFGKLRKRITAGSLLDLTPSISLRRAQ